MTVSSLWKILQNSNCGKCVGEQELATGRLKSTSDIDGRNHCQTTSSSSNNGLAKQTLAIDLSIWICESLSSQGMHEQHLNPTLYLVFTRTIKLLNLGVKLIFVVEGKSRVRSESYEEDHFRKRRSATVFWKACHDCHQMLRLLGVRVVRAKAEGEALCALLCQRGIADGVISNDGDCLLFGAKTVYTKFSIENLESNCVVRYDLNDLYALVDNSIDDDGGSKCNNRAPRPLQKTVRLSREDLVVFAILTGSDIVGSGLTKVGYKKALRFICKCRADNPLLSETAALAEMQSWAKAALASKIGMYCMDVHEPDETHNHDNNPNCSRCCHSGSKRDHLKSGCEVCGTLPGESCYKLTSDDRFRKSLREKALSMQPPFDPNKAWAAYIHPNENQLPVQFCDLNCRNQFFSPQISELLKMNVIVKGKSLSGSRAYLQQALGRLLSRAELILPSSENSINQQIETSCSDNRFSNERPIARRIEKSLVHKGVASYQLLWYVNATVTDENGEGIDGYEFNTIEPAEIVHKRYPRLILAFHESEKERCKQGDGEKVRRRDFLEALLLGDDDMNQLKKRQALNPTREYFFQHKKCHAHSGTIVHRESDDVMHLLRFVQKCNTRPSPDAPFEDSEQCLSSLGCATACEKNQSQATKDKRTEAANFTLAGIPPLTTFEDTYCEMGGVHLALSPMACKNGKFPPRHIFTFIREQYSD